MEAKDMGRSGMAFSILAIAAGAVMYWAVTSQGHGFRLSTVGVILMVVGVVGLIASTIVFATSRNPAGSRHKTYDREVTDALGRSTAVHEEVR
jgi:apolipoprotein N-acyltransferase